MPRAAVFVSENCSPPNTDDALLLEALNARGVDASPVVWDAAPYSDSFTFGVIRSTWDYVFKSTQYRAWLAEASRQMTLLNPLETALWSLDKRYLFELERSGVSVIPMHCITQPSVEGLRRFATEAGWEDVVVKSVLSAGGRQVSRVNEWDDWIIAEALDKVGIELPILVQPYLSGIEEGEYSLVYIGGELSHAVTKRPAHGEFLVQEHYGGSVEVATVPSEVAQAADLAIAALTVPWVYARVDALVDERLGPRIVEIEMIEPDLFLRYAPGSAERLAYCLEREAEGV
jgi:glutathione synthase/RimK-type ligase-like ATP-grasp enzyme